jgi:energy-converting hydrogenase B subunit Q
MPRRQTQALPPAVAVHLEVVDDPRAISVIAGRVAEVGGRVRTLSTMRRGAAGRGGAGAGEPAGAGAGAGPDAAGHPIAELELEVEGAEEHVLLGALEALDEVVAIRLTRALGRVFGKRVIVVGGGAQVAQVALGAVSEADRHNLRGERISVDTIPLVGEENIASAVRAVADLPRARLLVLAGSIMGGEISRAADELRAVGIPIIALNMVGSITEHVDLVVSDPVQAGTMAVMAVADTATFDLARQRGRRY